MFFLCTWWEFSQPLLGKSTASDGGSLNSCLLCSWCLYVFCWSCSQAPLHCSLQKGLLALTSAGAKHLTAVRLQPSAPSKCNCGLSFAENIKQWLITLTLPEAVFEQEKELISHSIGKVFSIFKKLNWRKTDPWSSCEDRFAWPLHHEEMSVHSWDLTAGKESQPGLEPAFCSSPALTPWRGLHSQDGTWNHTCRDF